VAALIKRDTGLDTEVVPAGRGEFTVWVDGAKVAEKSARGFPVDADLLAAVAAAVATT